MTEEWHDAGGQGRPLCGGGVELGLVEVEELVQEHARGNRAVFGRMQQKGHPSRTMRKKLHLRPQRVNDEAGGAAGEGAWSGTGMASPRVAGQAVRHSRGAPLLTLCAASPGHLAAVRMLTQQGWVGPRPQFFSSRVTGLLLLTWLAHGAGWSKGPCHEQTGGEGAHM